MVDSVEFNPGIVELGINFNEYINNFYSSLMSLNTINQKRARFRLFSNKIEKNIKNNISFYLGCILWGYHLYTTYQNYPTNITGNLLLDMGEEEKKEYDYMIQVNFMENYFDSFERDMLYYTGKKYIIPEKWKNILSVYSEFLQINNGFLNLSNTKDLIIPDCMKKIEYPKDIKSIIEKAVAEKNIEIILNNVDFSLKS